MTTVRDLIDFLGVLEKEGGSLINYPQIDIDKFRDLFIRIGKYDDFNPEDTKGLQQVLEKLPKDDWEKELTDKLSVEKDPKMDSKALTSDETRRFLEVQEQFERHQAEKEGRKAESKLAFLERQKTQEFIAQLTRLKNEADKLKERGIADTKEIDQILIAEEIIKTEIKDKSQEDIREVAIELAALDETTTDLKEIQEKAQEILEEAGAEPDEIEAITDWVQDEVVEDRIGEILDTESPTDNVEAVEKLRETIADEGEIKSVLDEMGVVDKEDVDQIIEIIKSDKEVSEVKFETRTVDGETVEAEASVETNIKEVLAKEPPEEVEAMVAKLIEITSAEENLSEVKTKVEEILTQSGVRNNQEIKDIVEIVRAEVAREVEVKFEERLVSDAVAVLIKGQDLDSRTVKEIREVVKERVHKAVVYPSENINETDIQAKGDLEAVGSYRVETTPSFVNEIKQTAPEINEVQAKKAAETIQSEVEELFHVDIDGKSSNVRDAVILNIKKGFIEELISCDVGEEEANEMAEMIYPEGEQGQAQKIGPKASRQGNIVASLLKSKDTIDASLEKSKNVIEKAGKLKEIKALSGVISKIENAPGMKSVMEMVRKAVAFNEKINAFPGTIMARVGKTFGFEGVEKTGLNLLARYGGTLGAEVGSQIAALGLEQGLWTSLTLLIKTGKVGMAAVGKMAVKVGIEAGATAVEVGAATTAAAASASTIAGIPIALIIMAAEAVNFLINAFKDFSKEKVDDVMDKLGLFTKKQTEELKDTFGDFMGGMMDVGLKIGLVLLSIPAMMAAAFAATTMMIALVVPLTIGGLYAAQTFFGSEVSSIMPNIASLGTGGGGGSGGGGGGGGSEVPADPIYDDSCAESPAYCVVDYFLGNGVSVINSSNVQAAANLINAWTNAPAGFNKAAFNSAMIASSNAFVSFQCVGFAVGIDGRINADGVWGGSVSGWNNMIANGSSGCPRIQASGAGVGDMILFPTGSWYHIVVLSKLRPDGSFAISQANWGSPGQVSNFEGPDIQAYLAGKSVLRCN